MIVKSLAAIKETDSIDIFDDSDWDFLKEKDSLKGNLILLDGDIDRDFDIKHSIKEKLLTVGAIVIAVALIISLVVMTINNLYGGISTDRQYNDSVNEVEVSNKILRVDGEPATSSDLVQISLLFDNYFGITGSESGLSQLDSLCVAGSMFASTEESYRENIKHSYDTNDCYARAIKAMVGYMSVDTINEIIVKDDKYYCYISLKAPDKTALYEYFLNYAYEMSKYFSTSDIDSINVTKYILQRSDTGSFPVTSQEFVFILTKTPEGKFLLTDDTQITDICTGSYSESITSIVTILGSRQVNAAHE